MWRLACGACMEPVVGGSSRLGPAQWVLIFTLLCFLFLQEESKTYNQLEINIQTIYLSTDIHCDTAEIYHTPSRQPPALYLYLDERLESRRAHTIGTH